jgi:tight adherence protein C
VSTIEAFGVNGVISGLVTSNLLYLGVFVLVAAAVYGLMFSVRAMLAARENPIERRMRTSLAPTAGELASAPSVLEPARNTSSLLDATLRPLAAVAKPTDEEELAGVRSRLSHAGFRAERALYVYLVAKLTLCMGAGGLVIWYNAGQAQPLEQAALCTVLAMFGGYYLPNLWLSGRVKERQALIERALPDALDLLVTCVEAGLSLDQALNRIAGEVSLSSPLLASELLTCALEMRAGLGRGEAMRRLANRTGVEELKYLASIIVQTEMFGTSVAKSLRIMSDSMRVRRTQRAEERAAMVAVKMTIPLVLCILPSLFTVLLGPAVINIIRIMLPALGGGTQQ